MHFLSVCIILKMNVVGLKTVKKLLEARVAACFLLLKMPLAVVFKLSVNARMICSK